MFSLIVQFLTTIHSPFQTVKTFWSSTLLKSSTETGFEIKVHFILNKISVMYQKIMQDVLKELKCQFGCWKHFESDK